MILRHWSNNCLSVGLWNNAIKCTITSWWWWKPLNKHENKQAVIKTIIPFLLVLGLFKQNCFHADAFIQNKLSTQSPSHNEFPVKQQVFHQQCFKAASCDYVNLKTCQKILLLTPRNAEQQKLDCNIYYIHEQKTPQSDENQVFNDSTKYWCDNWISIFSNSDLDLDHRHLGSNPKLRLIKLPIQQV